MNGLTHLVAGIDTAVDLDERQQAQQAVLIDALTSRLGDDAAANHMQPDPQPMPVCDGVDEWGTWR